MLGGWRFSSARFFSDSGIPRAPLPPPPLFSPDNPEERARALWFEEYADTKVGETVAAVFFQRVVRPNVLKQKTDSEHLEHLLNKALPEVCDYLTACLGEHEYMAGGQFSIADIAITSPLSISPWRVRLSMNPVGLAYLAT